MPPMLRYALTRLWQSMIAIVLSSILVFLGARLLPGDPALALAGEEATPERIAEARIQMGLDQPLWVQYVRFIERLFQGNFGQSFRTGASVKSMLATTIPVTVELALFAILLAVLFGILFGVIAERCDGHWPSWLVSAIAVAGLSIPNFWLGMLAIQTLCVSLGWFPASGYVSPGENFGQSLYHLVLPASVLAFQLIASITRQMKNSMKKTMGSDYIVTANAKGLSPWRVLMRYGVRNSLGVVVTIVGLQLGGLLAGAVVTESIFGLPGFGKMILDSVFSRDYPVIQVVVLIITITYTVINFLVDLLYSFLDPRIKVGGRQ